MKEITEQKLKKYISITEKALKKTKKINDKKKADIILEMANCYLSDAKHYMKKGDFVTAFAAINYAHGWLDCGARLGIFDVDNKDNIFTVD